jgi:hypothetical protein
MFVDNFDHDGEEPEGLKRLRGEALDIQVLSTANKVSVFWITETHARASRVTNWIKNEKLVFDKSLGYPWNKIVSFDPGRMP